MLSLKTLFPALIPAIVGLLGLLALFNPAHAAPRASAALPPVRQLVMAAETDPATLSRYQVTFTGEGRIKLPGEPGSSESPTGASILDLRVERKLDAGGGTVTGGFHARAFFAASDVANGTVPPVSSILKAVEAYARVLPDGADGIHVVSLSVGNSWIAFGYGESEKASFATFPLASSLSTSGIGFVPNATITYENLETGFVVDGSAFSPQENASFMDLENQGFSLRVRKGIPITTHLDAEVMGSYANLYFPTREEREHRTAVGGKLSARIGQNLKVQAVAEAFRQRKFTPGEESEVVGWLALVNVTRGRFSMDARYSRTRDASGATTSEAGVSGSYQVTRPGSRVNVRVTAGVSQQRGPIVVGPRPGPRVNVGIVITPGKRRRR